MPGMFQLSTASRTDQPVAARGLQILFSKINDAKLKEDIFLGPQIRKLYQDGTFKKKFSLEELPAWKSFVTVMKGFSGNHITR